MNNGRLHHPKVIEVSDGHFAVTPNGGRRMSLRPVSFEHRLRIEGGKREGNVGKINGQCVQLSVVTVCIGVSLGNSHE